MTIDQVKSAKSADLDILYQIERNDGTIVKGAIDGPYLGDAGDIRGYTEPYIYVTRIDVPPPSVIAIKCNDIKSIQEL